MKTKICAGQADIEEKMSDKRNKQLKDVVHVVEEQAKRLFKEFNSVLQEPRRETEAAGHRLQFVHRELATRLKAVENRTRNGGRGTAGTSANMVKPQEFDEFASWAVFHCQLQATHLLGVLQGQVADVLCRVMARATLRGYQRSSERRLRGSLTGSG
jgi:hypothetical protein